MVGRYLFLKSSTSLGLFAFILYVSSLNEWQLAAIQYVFSSSFFPKSNHDMVPVTYNAVHIPNSQTADLLQAQRPKTSWQPDYIIRCMESKPKVIVACSRQAFQHPLFLLNILCFLSLYVFFNFKISSWINKYDGVLPLPRNINHRIAFIFSRESL